MTNSPASEPLPCTSSSSEEIRQHLKSFIADHPNGTYEEWIAALDPSHAEKGGLLAFDLPPVGVATTTVVVICDSFYAKDSPHRKIWNESICAGEHGEKRTEVAARGGDSSSVVAPGGGGSAFAGPDLLSGDDRSASSKTETKQVSPSLPAGEDLISFD